VREAAGGGSGPVVTRQYGLSVQGRPLLVTIVGAADADRIMVLGCLHGDECGAAPILEELGRSTPPAGAGYYLIEHPNPDGEALGTRTNAHQVDLNRNFAGWQPSTPGPLYYSGSGPLSEPESAALAALILERPPVAVISYHQALNLVDWSGDQSSAAAASFAADTGMPLQGTTAFAGSLATWLGARHGETRVLTVELPRPVTADLAARNVTAVEHLAG
jgi:murein peptide amidase A